MGPGAHSASIDSAAPFSPLNATAGADMNREFKASSKQARSTFGVMAVLATVLVLVSIDGLSQHYSAESQVAGAKPLNVTRL